MQRCFNTFCIYFWSCLIWKTALLVSRYCRILQNYRRVRVCRVQNHMRMNCLEKHLQEDHLNTLGLFLSETGPRKEEAIVNTYGTLGRLISTAKCQGQLALPQCCASLALLLLVRDSPHRALLSGVVNLQQIQDFEQVGGVQSVLGPGLLALEGYGRFHWPPTLLRKRGWASCSGKIGSLVPMNG